jgi:arylsulfatase A-like enzyme
MLAEEKQRRRGERVARFCLLGATLGLILGIFEAALLYFVPWLPTLVEPDVGYVVWFVVPLVNLLFYGLLGAALGCLASLGRVSSPERGMALAAALVGVAGAHVAWAITLVHVWTGAVDPLANPTMPLTWLGIISGSTFLIASILRRRAPRVFDAATRWPVGPASKAVLGAMAILIAALGLHQLRRLDLPFFEQANATVSPARPNIILITLDTVRADHLSAYGYERLTTPNLDHLAWRGVMFEEAVAPSSWTLASHASILTGLLPHQHEANIYEPLDEAPRTLAEILHSHGYETAGFNANNAYGQGSWGLDQGFGIYDDSRSMILHNLPRTLVARAIFRPIRQHWVPQGLNSHRRNAADVNQDVVRWFRHRSNRPFFLFINYFDAHGPYYAPPPYDNRFGRISRASVRGLIFSELFPHRKPLTPEDYASFMNGYDNCVAYLDDQVGRLLDELSHSPDWANTIVIVTSDHGEAFGTHGSYLHGRNVYYEEALHVPLMISGPGIPAGVRIAHPARLRELFPTVLDFALGPEVPFHHKSLRRFWTPGFKPGPADDWVVSELVPFLPDYRPAMISLTTSEWHYIHDSTGKSELYRWREDPQEQTDLSTHPGQRLTVEDLQQRLDQVVGTSLRPWRDPEYLLALDRPGHSFLSEALFGSLQEHAADFPVSPVGASQAFFTPGRRSSPKRPLPAEVQSLRSLPYR